MTLAHGRGDAAGIENAVSALVGGDAVVPGPGGIPVVRPASDAEAADLLRVAAERRWRVVPMGSGLAPESSAIESGAAGARDGLAPPDLILSTGAMVGIVEHEPGDLNVRARAGSTLSMVQSTVAEAGQWLPLDPPAAQEASVGGITATGMAGPLGARYGRPRDQILGLTLVDGAGRILSLGGRVVKNVAGFDLVRLVAGSRGVLGVITEIVFRLYPIPEEDRTLVWRRRDLGSAWDLGRAAVTLPVPVAAAELLAGEWPDPVPDGGPLVLLRLTGSAKEVKEVADQMSRSVGPPDEDLTGESTAAIFNRLSHAEGEGNGMISAHALPSRGRDLLYGLHGLPTKRLAFHLLGGSLRGWLAPADSDELATAARGFEAMGAEVRGLGGGSGTAFAAVGTVPSRVDRLRGEIIRGFDPSGILPGAWRDGRLEGVA